MGSLTKVCVDCRENPYTITTRQRDLCNDCYAKLISSKVFKRIAMTIMQDVKFGDKIRLLLPISGGVSSLTLLQLLNAQIEKQIQQQGQTSYDVTCIHVQEGQLSSEWWVDVASTFPHVRCLPERHFRDVLSIDEGLERDLGAFGLERSGDADEQFVARMFEMARSATAKADLRDILMKRLILATTKREGCSGILWGHSDSKLAALTLASVAKGRGNGVPSELADGSVVHGVKFFHPLRDLSQIELTAYIEMQSPEVKKCRVIAAADIPLTLRGTSIDALMTTYITSQGEKYPSVMANVVKTASKLQAPKNGMKSCQICTTPVSLQQAQLCYGCERLKQDFKFDR